VKTIVICHIKSFFDIFEVDTKHVVLATDWFDNKFSPSESLLDVLNILLSFRRGPSNSFPRLVCHADRSTDQHREPSCSCTAFCDCLSGR
jgi:hypothetical protein